MNRGTKDAKVTHSGMLDRPRLANVDHRKGSSMKMLVVIAAASMSMVAVAPVQAQEALAKSAGCMNCHAVDTKKVGPAFKDVAAKYKGKADAEATIVTELTTAKGHPAVKASPDDVKSLVKWVLSL